MAKARPQLNKMGGNGPARKAPMSRTAGTAKRLLGASESIGFKKKYGMPLTGSASGVKSITTKQAGETLTQGIVTLNKKNKFQVDPVGLAFALPVGKVTAAAKALRAAGKIEQATALEARVAAKTAGKFFGASERGIATDRAIDVGGRARMASERVFKRLPNNSIPGSTRTFDTYADPLLEGAERFKGKVSLDTLIQGSKSRSGMNRVKVASEVAKGLSKYRKPKGR